MAALEYFEVECPEPLGAEYYKQITNDVLLDHNLLKVIEKLHIYIDPKVPVFVAVGTLRKITTDRPGPRFCQREPARRQDHARHLGRDLSCPDAEDLLGAFGKDHVEQPDRFTVMLYDVKMDPREIERSGGCRPERVPLPGPDLRVPVHCAGRVPAAEREVCTRRSSRLLQARTRLPRISMRWLQRSSP